MIDNWLGWLSASARMKCNRLGLIDIFISNINLQELHNNKVSQKIKRLSYQI